MEGFDYDSQEDAQECMGKWMRMSSILTQCVIVHTHGLLC